MTINSFAINGLPINGTQNNSDIELANISINCPDIFSGSILPTLSKIKILQGGQNFDVTNQYDVVDNNGRMIVKSCQDGAITSIDYINFGYNFYYNFQQILYPSSTKDYAKASITIENGKVIDIDLIHGGSGYTSPVNVKIIGGNGYGAIASCTVSGGSITAINLLFQGNFYTHVPSIVFDTDVAVIEHQVGIVRKYPGHYVASDSLISDNSFLYDGKFYQNFSYEIEVDMLFDKYKNIVKKILHPVGYNLFGAYSRFDKKIVTALAKQLSQQFDQYPIDQTFIYENFIKHFYKVLTETNLSTLENDFYKHFIKALSENTELITEIIAKHVYKVFSENSEIVQDVYKNHLTKVLDDQSENITDYYYAFFTKVASDSTQNVSDNTVKELIKAFTDATSNLTDSYTNTIIKGIDETISSFNETTVLNISKLLTDITEAVVDMIDMAGYGLLKGVADTLNNLTDTTTISSNLVKSDSTSNLTDVYSSTITKTLSDVTEYILDNILVPILLHFDDFIDATDLDTTQSYGTSLNKDYFAQDYGILVTNFSKTL